MKPELRPLQAVLFDLGDTLVDLGEGRGSYESRVLERAGCVYDALASYGVVLPERTSFCGALAVDSENQYHAALNELRGIDVFTIMATFLARQGLPSTDALVQAAGTAYCRGNGQDPAPLRSGVLAVLTALHSRGMRLGIISNTIQPARHMDESLAERGLAFLLDVRVYSSEVGLAKPHPAIFRAALDRLALPASAVVYVGDRLEADVVGAQRAGMKGVLIEVAHRVERHAHITPDARIRELPELLDVLPQFEP